MHAPLICMLAIASAISGGEVEAAQEPSDRRAPWELQLAFGQLFWQQAHGDRRPNWLVHFEGKRLMREPWYVYAGLEYSNNFESTRQLDMSLHRFGPCIGAGIQWWLSKTRLDAGLGSGLLWKTSRIDDHRAAVRRLYGLAFFTELHGGASLRILPAWLLGVRAAFRYEPDRWHRALVFAVGWSP